MSGEHELPTASVVRSSQATPARRRGQLFTDVRPAGSPLIEVRSVFRQPGPPLIFTAPNQTRLHLRYGSTEQVLEQANAAIVLGRDASCEVALADRMASRRHARIERRQGKFFLIDKSTNGTFVAFAGESEITLQREEVMLRGQGRIAFGRSVSEASDETVEFSVRG